jgi:hypothetical protein
MSRPERSRGKFSVVESKRQRLVFASAKPRKSGHLLAFIIGIGVTAVGFATLGRSVRSAQETTRPIAQELPASYYELLAMPSDERRKVESP